MRTLEEVTELAAVEARNESGKDVSRSRVAGQGIPEELQLQMAWETWLL